MGFRIVRAADLAHLTNREQPIECFEGVLDWGVFVGPVQLLEIYTVGI